MWQDGNCDIAATSINYNEAAGNGGGIYVAGGECRIATQTIGLNDSEPETAAVCMWHPEQK